MMGLAGMPGGVGSIVATLGLLDANFSSGLDKANKEADASAKRINTAMNVISLAAAGAFAVAAKSAIDFETGMANVNTLLDVSDTQFKKLGDDLIDLSTRVPGSMESFTKGLYDLVSAGESSENAINSLELAAQAAAAGVSTVDTAIAAGMANVNAFGLETSELTKIYDLQFSTVKKGVLTFEQLAGSIGTVLPSAKTLGVSLEDMYGSIAFLTKSGQSADMATTNLSRAFDSLSTQKDKLKALGVNVFDASGKFVGMQSVVGDLAKAMEGMNDETKLATLQTLDFDIRASRAINSMINNYDGFVKTMGDVADSSGAMKDAFEKQMATFKAQADLFKNIVKSSMITTGEGLLGVLTPILNILNKHPDAIRAVITTMLNLVLKLGTLAAAYKTIMAIHKAYNAIMKVSGSSLGAVGLALTAAITLYEIYKNVVQAAKKAQEDEIKAVNESTTKLSDLHSQYEKLKNQTGLSATQQLELEKVTKQLSDELAKQGKTIEDVNGNFDDFIIKQGEAGKTDLANQIAETEKKIAAASEKVKKYSDDLNYNSSIVSHNKDIIKEQNDKLTLLKQEYAKATDKVNSHKDALELLNKKEINAQDEIKKHVSQLENALEANKDNKEMTDKLTQELEKYRAKIVEVNNVAVVHKSLSEQLKEAGIKLKSEVEAETKQLENLIGKVKENSYEYVQLKEKLSDVYLEMKNADAYLELNDKTVELNDVSEQMIRGLSEAPDKLEPLLGTFEGLGNNVEDTRGYFEKWWDELDGQDYAGYIGQISNMTKEFFDLGPTASGAVDLLTEGLQGLLTGSLDPISLGLKGVNLVMGLFKGKNEEIVRSLEDVKESLGSTWIEIENLREAWSKTGVESSMIDWMNNQIDIYVKNLQTATGSSRAYWEKMIAETKADMEEFMSFFSTDVEFNETIEGLDKIVQKIDEVGDYYGTSGNAADLLRDKINDATTFMYNNLEKGSQAWIDMQAKIDAATKKLYEISDAQQLWQDLMQAGVAGHDELEKRLRFLIETGHDLNETFTDATGKTWTLKEQLETFGLTTEEINRIIKEYEENLKETTDATNENTESVKKNNEELRKRKGLTDYLSDAGIKLTNEIRDQLNLFAGLSGQVVKNSFEYRQLQEKIDSVINSFVDSSAPIEEQIAQLEALRNTSGLGKDAIELLNKRIAEMKNTQAIKKAKDAAEALTKEYVKMNAKLEDLKKQRIDLDAQFNIDKKKIEDKINDTQTKINDILQKKNDLKLQFDIDKKNLDLKVSRLKNIIELMDTGEPVNLYKINNLIEKLSGNTQRLTISWGAMVETMVQEYSGFESDLKTASDALDTITKFKVDLDTTGADEQINALIFKMWDYMATLDPNSAAYKDMKNSLDDLTKRFLDAGGVIDEELAKQSSQDYAEEGIKTLEQQLLALMSEYNDADMQLNVELEGLYADLDKLELDLDAIIKEYDGKKIKLDLEIDILSETIKKLLEKIAGAGASAGGVMHVGGIVGMDSAHTGILAANEQMYKLKAGEAVIPANVVSRYNTSDWNRLIRTGDVSSLVGSEVLKSFAQDSGGRKQINIEAVIQTGDPNTRAWFKERYENEYNVQNKYKRNLTTYGY